MPHTADLRRITTPSPIYNCITVYRKVSKCKIIYEIAKKYREGLLQSTVNPSHLKLGVEIYRTVQQLIRYFGTQPILPITRDRVKIQTHACEHAFFVPEQFYGILPCSVEANDIARARTELTRLLVEMFTFRHEYVYNSDTDTYSLYAKGYELYTPGLHTAFGTMLNNIAIDYVAEKILTFRHFKTHTLHNEVYDIFNNIVEHIAKRICMTPEKTWEVIGHGLMYHTFPYISALKQIYGEEAYPKILHIEEYKNTFQ